jgi:hypothetical protein
MSCANVVHELIVPAEGVTAFQCGTNKTSFALM